MSKGVGFLSFKREKTWQVPNVSLTKDPESPPRSLLPLPRTCCFQDGLLAVRVQPHPRQSTDSHGSAVFHYFQMSNGLFLLVFPNQSWSHNSLPSSALCTLLPLVSVLLQGFISRVEEAPWLGFCT